MNLTDNLQALADAVGDEVKKVRVFINNNATTLGALTTTNKSNLVAAVNELKDAIDSIVAAGGASINDTTTNTTSTWSSSKISAALAGILDGVSEDFDTLAEIAAAIGNDPAFLTNLQTQIDHKVSWNTAAQGLSDSQKNNARINIGAAGADDVGDTTTDFVTVFQTGLL
jgi:hypothetical protein